MKENKDSETRLGVKFLEYLACELKVITNSNVGLACKIVEENNLGFNIDKDFDLFKRNKQSLNIFKKYFSPKNVIEKYIKIYRIS